MTTRGLREFEKLIPYAAIILLILGGCVGDSQTAVEDPYTPPSSTSPVITAELFSFPSGSTPATFINAVVHVNENKAGSPVIADAVVSVNGVTLPYNAAQYHYEGNVAVAPGESVILSVTADGETYSASGAQFTSYPAISAPAPNEVWSTFYTNTIRWSEVAAPANSFYILRIVRSEDPNVRVWPSGSLQKELPMGVVSHSIYGNEGVDSSLWGDRLLFVGIAQRVPIPDAASGSAMVISALNSVPVSFRYELPDYGFGDGVRYPLPDGVNLQLADTIIGDLNGDGLNDVAVIKNFNGTGKILIYSQNTGTLSVPANSFSVDFNLTGAAIADINGDTYADLIVSGNSITASGYPGRLGVFLQHPALHTLGAAQQYILSMNDAIAMAAADLNNDGLADVVVAGQDSNESGVVSFLFQNSGMLGPEALYTDTPVHWYAQVRVADMNNDNRNDVVIQSAGKQIAVIKQSFASPGNFLAPDFYLADSVFVGFYAFGLGDLNGDDLTDLMVVDYGNSTSMNIFLQNAGGTLSSPSLLHVSTQAQEEVEIADLDADGLNDLIFLSSGYRIQVMYQAADHSFGHPLTSYMPTLTYGGTFEYNVMSVGDVTGDNLPDVITSWSNEGVFVLPRVP